MRDFLEKHAPPVIIVVLFYIVGSFIAWDLDPLHWFLFTNVIGRFWFVIILGAFVKATIDHYKDY